MANRKTVRGSYVPQIEKLEDRCNPVSLTHVTASLGFYHYLLIDGTPKADDIRVEQESSTLSVYDASKLIGVFDIAQCPDGIWYNAGGGDDFLIFNVDDRVKTQGHGGPGNDTIVGGEGWDWIGGDDGNDLLYGRGTQDQVIGDSGNDTLYGGAGDDFLVGLAGDDLLFGGSGNDFLIDGFGRDTLMGEGGDDHLYAGSPVRRTIIVIGPVVPANLPPAQPVFVSFSQTKLEAPAIQLPMPEAIPATTSLATRHFNVVEQQPLFFGEHSAHYEEGNGNVLDGGDGDDFIVGSRGNDTFTGGDGNDFFFANGGEDTFVDHGEVDPSILLMPETDNPYVWHDALYWLFQY